jgi:hypothetical protein
LHLVTRGSTVEEFPMVSQQFETWDTCILII